MKKWLMLGLCFWTLTTLHAQVITILDLESNKPLEFVTLSHDLSATFVVSNGEGQVSLSAFGPGQEISVQLMGYEPRTINFDTLEKLNAQLYLSPTKINLDQVIISATRWNQSKGDIPSKITTISAKNVALQNPQTAADLLAQSGDVFIQKSQQGGGSPMIRGFSTNRLLYTIDGIRMNTAIFRSGNLHNVISIDPLALEGAEVLFGPGSIIYGSDAIGAVMSFQTLQPQLSPEGPIAVGGKALARFSSANSEMTSHLDLGIGWKKWAAITSFSHNNYGNLRMGRFGPKTYLSHYTVARQNGQDVVLNNPDPLVQIPTGYEQISLMQKLLFAPSDHLDFQYGFHYSSTTDFPRYDRLLRTKDGLPRSAEWFYGPQSWMMNNLTISYQPSVTFFNKMVIRLAHQKFEESRIDRNFDDPIQRRRTEKVQAISANVDFQKKTGGKATLFYGLEYVQNNVNSTGLLIDINTREEEAGVARYPTATWTSLAGYATYQWKFSSNWLLQLGGRYNQFILDADFSNNEAFLPLPENQFSLSKGSFTGSMGLIVRPTQKLTFSGQVSTGFRAPNVDDMGKVFDSEPGAVVVPNPALDAEYAYNAEIGLAKVFGDAIRVDLTAYFTRLDNAMVRRNFTLNGQDSMVYDGEISQIQAVQNAAQATVIGVQMGLEIKLPAGFSLNSKINLQQGEEELDDGTISPSRHSAPWFGVTQLQFRQADLECQISATYSGGFSFEQLPVGEQAKAYLYALDAKGNPYAPGWYTLDFKMLYSVSNHLTISAGVENLTDQRYKTYSSGIAAAGRNLILTATAHF